MDEKICRLCLRREGEFFDLFAPPTKGKANLVDQLGAILNFEFVKDARLPSAICTNCYQIQEFIIEFRVSCSRVNNYLNELLKVAPTNNEVGSCEQVTPAAKDERSCSDVTKKKSRPLELSGHAAKSCSDGSAVRKMLKLAGAKETVKKISSNSRHISVISDGRTLNKHPKTKTIETSQPSMPWEIMKRNSNIDEGYDGLQLLESKAKHVPTVSSIPDRTGQVNDERIGNNVIDIDLTQDGGCKEVSEITSLEDHDTVEMKIPFELEEKSVAPVEYDATKDNKKEVMEEDHWSRVGKQSEEFQVKQEEEILTEPLFDVDDLEEASQDELMSFATVPEDRTPSNDPREEIPSEITSSIVDINKAVYIKLLEMQDSGDKLTTQTIKDTALKVAEQYGLLHFSASNGWLLSFIRRYEIGQRSDEVKLPAYSMGITLTNCYIARYCCKELNDAVYRVCCGMSTAGVELKSHLVKNIARRIATNEGLYEFSASAAWLKSFKKFYNLEVGDANTKQRNT